MSSDLTVSKTSEPVALKLWIFKLTWNEFAVSVEGYRAKDDGERELFNWRSTPVVQRLTWRMLVTKSGTKYVLQGLIDEFSLLALGYPRALIEQFKEGFPPNWQEVLLQYHNSLTKSGLLSASRWFSTSIICGSKDGLGGMADRSSVTGPVLSELQPKRLDRRRSSTRLQRSSQHNMAKERIEEIEEEHEASTRSEASRRIQKPGRKGAISGSTGEGVHSDADVKGMHQKEGLQKSFPSKSDANDHGRVDKVFKVPHISTSSKQNLPLTKLYNWTLLFSIHDRGTSNLFSNFGLVLKGYSEEKQDDWQTSCIVAINDSRHLQTASTIYELVGPINTIAATQQGYPKGFVVNFLNGFPENWHTVISQLFDTYVEPHLALEEQRNRKVRPPAAVTEGDSGSWSGDDAMHGSYEANDSDHLDENLSSEHDSAVSPILSGEPRERDEPSTSKKKAKKCSLPTSSRRGRRSKRISTEAAIKKSAGQPSKKRPSVKKLATKVTVKGNERRSVHNEDMIRISRSGRIIKRPLASWAGERIVYDIRGEPVKAVGITTESPLTSGRAIGTSAVVSHLGLSPIREPLQKERGSFELPENGKPKRCSRKKRPLVAYSSTSSEITEDYTRYARDPLTPVVGRQRKQAWHVIHSSSDEGDGDQRGNRTTKQANQNNKRQPKRRNVQKKKTAKKVSVDRLKKQGERAVTKKETADSVEINALSDDDDDEGSIGVTEFNVSDGANSERDEMVENEQRQLMAHHQPSKRWRQHEIERLKLAVRAIKPREESDWEKVAKSLGGREASDCLVQAQKKLGWKPQKQPTRTDEERQLEELARAAGNARVGTVSHQLKTERFARKYIMGGTESDYFESTMDLRADGIVSGMPSVLDLEGNDSLIYAMRTPAPNEVKRANRRQFIPTLASSSESNDSQPRLSARFNIDSAERDRRGRYVHHLLKMKKHNMSRMNASSMNISRGCVIRNYQLSIPGNIRPVDQAEEEENTNSDNYFSSDDGI